MKSFLKWCWLIPLLVLVASCNTNEQTKSVKMMLKDPVQQKEIFSQITHDSTHMRQFMEYMMENRNDRHMMNNQHMMLGNMMNMMEKDSSYCNMFSGQMMNNAHFKGMMQNRFQKGGKMMGSSICPLHK